ncbi:hypothetical protein [Clostridium thailandense]
MNKFKFKSSDSIGYIAANFSKAMDIFKEYNILFSKLKDKLINK